MISIQQLDIGLTYVWTEISNHICPIKTIRRVKVSWIDWYGDTVHYVKEGETLTKETSIKRFLSIVSEDDQL